MGKDIVDSVRSLKKKGIEIDVSANGSLSVRDLDRYFETVKSKWLRSDTKVLRGMAVDLGYEPKERHPAWQAADEIERCHRVIRDMKKLIGLIEQKDNTVKYGYDHEGNEIVAPPGWRILKRGEQVPQIHREFLEGRNSSGYYQLWAAPRRCHSTMTASTARVWGAVRAYAVPDDSNTGN